MVDFFDVINQQGLDPVSFDYNIDIVMCIDSTGSMDPILDNVKRTARSFESLFKDAMRTEGKMVSQLRVKVISFKDYIIDAVPMRQSPFFTLPEEQNAFKAFLDSIEASGGGDEPENALEAIAMALESDWVSTGTKRRHVILLFTDASALPLRERSGCRDYPPNMPKDLGELGNWWEGVSQFHRSSYEANAGRMVVFAPRKEPWTQMRSWSRFWCSYNEKTGLEGTEMRDVISLLVGSVS